MLLSLSHAAFRGEYTSVSFLLSAGARENKQQVQTGASALAASIIAGHADVVRLLLHEGLEAVGGTLALPEALKLAILEERATILQMVTHAGDIMEESWVEKMRYEYRVTALEIAIWRDGLPAIQVLLSVMSDDTAVI